MNKTKKIGKRYKQFYKLLFSSKETQKKIRSKKKRFRKGVEYFNKSFCICMFISILFS